MNITHWRFLRSVYALQADPPFDALILDVHMPNVSKRVTTNTVDHCKPLHAHCCMQQCAVYAHTVDCIAVMLSAQLHMSVHMNTVQIISHAVFRLWLDQ
jgi:hypothetical protein